MEPKIIVMIVTLAMPNGDSGVHVKPMPTVDRCVTEANIEASDPFVAHVECSELADGKLLLDFKWRDEGKKEGATGLEKSETEPRVAS
ncbi:MAG TPA: hypothetical protein P5114_00645 [Hyphomicrobiaceae bacterium]|nr:hypothetical protein [Hyphomicrobiaceae bacterium]